jgi:Xaa-Pro aminopeptidase
MTKSCWKVAGRAGCVWKWDGAAGIGKLQLCSVLFPRSHSSVQTGAQSSARPSKGTHHVQQPNYESRRNKVRRQFREAGIDGLIVSGLANVKYLTGFTGDSSWLFLSRGRTVLLSDSRYETQLANECPDLEVEIRDAGSTIQNLAAAALAGGDSAHPGFEADHLSWNSAQRLISDVQASGSTQLLPTAGLVERIREVKDRWELAEIREAIRIAERGFGVMRSSLSGGQTELEVRETLERAMKAFGGAGTAFEPIVGVGPTAALPHAHAGQRLVSESPLLLVDWGAQVGSGYRSDLTRVLFTGRPTKQMQKVYEVVLQAEQAAFGRGSAAWKWIELLAE